MRYQFFLIVTLLVAAVFLAGCTGEDLSPIAETLSAEPPLPGQALVLVGDVTGDGLAGGTIDTLDITVSLVPGSRPIDMEKISIIYADTIKTESLIPVEGYWGNPPMGCWGILNVVDQVGDQNNRIEDKEQFVIRLNPRAYLPAKRMVVIVVRAPAVTTPLTIRRFAPAEIAAQGNILTPP